MKRSVDTRYFSIEDAIFGFWISLLVLLFSYTINSKCFLILALMKFTAIFFTSEIDYSWMLGRKRVSSGFGMSNFLKKFINMHYDLFLKELIWLICSISCQKNVCYNILITVNIFYKKRLDLFVAFIIIIKTQVLYSSLFRRNKFFLNIDYSVT